MQGVRVRVRVIGARASRIHPKPSLEPNLLGVRVRVRIRGRARVNLLDGVRVRRARIPSGGLPQLDAVLLGGLG